MTLPRNATGLWNIYVALGVGAVYLHPSRGVLKILPQPIQSLQYLSDTGYVDATSGTVYVAKGTTVSFRVVPMPPATDFSGGIPVWSGTSGASGVGQTIAVPFNTVSGSTIDLKTVTATLGNALTANVLVYDFDGVLTPDDNFEGRSLTDFGVGETISLSATFTPAITPEQAGGLVWEVVDGGGDITDNGDGTGSYTVPDSPGSFTLALRPQKGPSTDVKKSQAPRNKRLPEVTQVREAEVPLFHVQGKVSVGF